ncbi:MAG TPA: hypothetical protein V6D05_12215 [Stenomitos sp.]
MMIALAAEATGFGFMEKGYWYPGAAGQLFLLFVFTVFFTFLGSYWFGLAFPQRPMKSWMMGALKANIAWWVTIVAGILVPIKLYGVGATSLTGKVVGGMTMTPFIAESISGALTFGLAIVVVCLIVSFFYTKSAAWFYRT